MDKIKTAAIIILGMGDKFASEILRTMNPKEVQRVMDAINEIDSVSESDLLSALNVFFKESNNTTGLDISSRETIKNSLSSVFTFQGVDGEDNGFSKWIEMLKSEPAVNITEIIQDEHPQIIAAIIVVLSTLNADKATTVVKALPKVTQSLIIKKMTKMNPISTYAIEILGTYFERQLQDSEERYNVITVDGIEAAANIMSYLDRETEMEIITDLSASNKVLAEQVQDKILPFERLSKLDQKSLRTLLAEIKNDDLVLALKGVDEYVKSVFMKNMSVKSAELLKDEMESLGPVKLSRVVEAQKKIIALAKKMGKEEKIMLSTRHDDDVIF
ncbi:MAG: FliG C-terminal domain-containing protein [Gammaproteobacteria bacterium]|nr:FliG C-terminal domain-containing protein [Gammaproteobacteria bacterium]